jgi:thiol-disulfide isomerase/thioredoxin
MSASPSNTHEPDTESELFGRVGYGRLARYSPFLLAAVILAAVIYIALNQQDDGPPAGSLIGEQAPELTLTPFAGGQPYSLSSMKGNVVVLNFWAAWCEPCKAEMPAFEAVHAEGASDVRIVGVDIKNDKVDEATALIAETGVTYSLVRDGGGQHPVYGPIEQALGVSGSYPVTVFIRPDGVIDAIRIGELDESEIRDRIEDARD